MVLGDEYHRADHADCRATAGVTLQGGGVRSACPVERGRSRVCGPRPLPAQCRRDVFAARTGLPASPRPRDRMEVRHACRSSGEAGQPHDDGRPPHDRREGHPRGRRLRIPDRRLHRAHVRPGGGGGYRSRSPEPHCVRNCHDDSIGIAVCGCGGAACGRVAGGRRCPRSPRVGEARHPSRAGAFACRHDGDIASGLWLRKSSRKWRYWRFRPHRTPPQGETTKAGTEAVDALLASAQFADSAASGGSSRKSGSEHPEAGSA